MNAWQITLTALATIAGLCAFGFGMVALLRASNVTAAAIPHLDQPEGKPSPLTLVTWAAYVFVALVDRRDLNPLTEIATVIVYSFTALFWGYALIQMWRVRSARNWAFTAAGCAAVTISSLYLVTR